MGDHNRIRLKPREVHPRDFNGLVLISIPALLSDEENVVGYLAGMVCPRVHGQQVKTVELMRRCPGLKSHIFKPALPE